MGEYPYCWKSSETALDDFLKKYKPSMVVDDGTKPWIWVRRTEYEPLDETEPRDLEKDEEESKLEQAKLILDQYTEKITAVQKDDNIPIRSNKKKGLRSKKEVREEIMAEAAAELKRIAQEGKLTCGKWLFFATPEHIDGIWARLAHELVNGSLSKTPAFCAKVATTPSTTEPNHRYLICLYLPDLYDKDAATEVLRTACQSVGVRPNSAKADLYTLIGLDSKHPSGMKSTIWNPHDLVPEAELKTLVDSHWAEANKKQVKVPEQDEAANTSDTKPKNPVTKLKRKIEDSDDDNVFDEVDDPKPAKKEATSINAGSLKAKSTPRSKAPVDDSATESESDGPSPAKTAPATTEVAPATTKAIPKSDKAEDKVHDGTSSEEDVKRPKKARRF